MDVIVSILRFVCEYTRKLPQSTTKLIQIAPDLKIVHGPYGAEEYIRTWPKPDTITAGVRYSVASLTVRHMVVFCGPDMQTQNRVPTVSIVIHLSRLLSRGVREYERAVLSKTLLHSLAGKILDHATLCWMTLRGETDVVFHFFWYSISWVKFGQILLDQGQ